MNKILSILRTLQKILNHKLLSLPLQTTQNLIATLQTPNRKPIQNILQKIPLHLNLRPFHLPLQHLPKKLYNLLQIHQIRVKLLRILTILQIQPVLQPLLSLPILPNFSLLLLFPYHELCH